ncbi:MAG TPA: hypothetical protein VKA30_12630, partial [Actinomycetota bacterium]|nr:hypothetical protein [Actinomycetota bacterium]
MRRLITAIAVLAALSLAFLVSAGSVAATQRSGPLAASLSTIGPQNGGGEPSLAIDRDGTLYVSVPTLDPNETAFYRSTSNGRTWRKLGVADTNVGDTTVNIDRSGAVYQTNLNNVGEVDQLQVDVFKSFDRGKTWPQKGQGPVVSSNSSNMPLLVDRQWLDAWIPPGGNTNTARVYLTYHDFVPSQIWVNTSTDGGKTFGIPVDVINDP